MAAPRALATPRPLPAVVLFGQEWSNPMLFCRVQAQLNLLAATGLDTVTFQASERNRTESNASAHTSMPALASALARSACLGRTHAQSCRSHKSLLCFLYIASDHFRSHHVRSHHIRSNQIRYQVRGFWVPAGFGFQRILGSSGCWVSAGFGASGFWVPWVWVSAGFGCLEFCSFRATAGLVPTGTICAGKIRLARLELWGGVHYVYKP